MNKKLGFTLVELLGVIVILAIILAVAVPSILNIIQKAQDSAYTNNEKLLVKAAKLYLAANEQSNTGEVFTVQLSDLISNNFITQIKDSGTGSLCDGVVEVRKSSGNYTYIPYLECGSKYNLQHFSDTIVKIDNPKGEALQNLKVYGKSNQSGTPTVVAPVQIKSVADSGNFKIISAGRNLLNREELYNIAYNAGPTKTSLVIKDGRNCIKTRSIYTPGSPFTVKYKVNTQYTLEMEYFYEYDPTNLGMGLLIEYTDGALSYAMMSGNAVNNWYKQTYVTAASKTIKSIVWSYNSDIYTYINYDKIFMYEGNVTTPTYEPYRAYEYTINLSSPLRSLPDGTKDYIDFTRGKIIRNVGQLLADGSADENWGLDNLSGSVRYFFNISLGPGFPSATMLSNRFIYNSAAGQEGVKFSGARYIEAGVLTSRLSSDSVAGFRTWLAANPIEILYKLTTPVEENITLSSVLTNRGTTTLFTTDLNQPQLEFDVNVKE